MNTIKYIKTQNREGEISDNILIEVDAIHVDLENGSNVQSAIDNINSNLASIAEEISNINNNITEATNEIDNINNIINNINIEIDNINNDIDTFDSDINDINHSIEMMNNDITDLYNRINSREIIDNKVTAIDEYSTDIEYPSAKAVYDLFTSLKNLIENRE